MHIKAALLTVLPVVSAHFHVLYPPWRGDAIAETNATISEWFYPCKHLRSPKFPQTSYSFTLIGAGFNNASSNRTQWPLKGGAVVWNSSHPSALTYINLGLGNVVTSFNISLQPVYNETGAGVTCLPNPGAAAIAGLNVTEGQNASVQFITIGESGSALYSVRTAAFSFAYSAPG
jgi:hypothetical protein